VCVYIYRIQPCDALSCAGCPRRRDHVPPERGQAGGAAAEQVPGPVHHPALRDLHAAGRGVPGPGSHRGPGTTDSACFCLGFLIVVILFSGFLFVL